MIFGLLLLLLPLLPLLLVLVPKLSRIKAGGFALEIASKNPVFDEDSAAASLPLFLHIFSSSIFAFTSLHIFLLATSSLFTLRTSAIRITEELNDKFSK